VFQGAFVSDKRVGGRRSSSEAGNKWRLKIAKCEGFIVFVGLLKMSFSCPTCRPGPTWPNSSYATEKIELISVKRFKRVTLKTNSTIMKY
jgi:hypothetical protein